MAQPSQTLSVLDSISYYLVQGLITVAIRMVENSHRTIIIRALICTALYWPLWRLNVWIINHGLYNLGPLGKVLFYINLFYMLINWYLIANRKSEVDRETVKFSLFIIIVLVLMELPTWIYVFHRGQG